MCLVTRAGDAAAGPRAHAERMSADPACAAFMVALFACVHVHAEDAAGAGVYRAPPGWELFDEDKPLAIGDLALHDTRELGGDDDGSITAADAIWPRLQLWLDLDADGVAARTELRPVAGLGLRALRLETPCSGIKPPHERHSRVHVELAEHLAHLCLDGIHRDAPVSGDLRDRPPFAELPRDVGFGAAEFRHDRHGAVVPWPAPGRHIYICTDAALRPPILSW
jgi:hypothetical protein